MSDDEERALLDEIARDPEDLVAYEVYGDWLLAQGDPRGELFALWRGSEERPGDHRLSDAADAHLVEHAGELLGPLASFVTEQGWDQHLELTWRGGFIASAVLRDWDPNDGDEERSPREVLSELLTLPAARFLTRLRIDAYNVASALAAQPLPALRYLAFGFEMSNRERNSGDFRELGELDWIWRSVPELRELVVNGEPESLGHIQLPALRRATFRMPPTRAPGIRALTTAEWPQLEALELWYGHDRDSIAALLARTELVTLGDVGFIASQHADMICSMLVRAPLAPQLHRVSFARSLLTDDGLRTLIAHRTELPSLATLDLTATRVSPAMVEEARAAFGQVWAQALGARFWGDYADDDEW